MTDLSATMGCDALKDFNKIYKHRKKIYYTYLQELSPNNKVKCIHDDKKRTWCLVIYNSCEQQGLRSKN